MNKKVRSRAIRLLLVPFAAALFLIGWTLAYFADKKPESHTQEFNSTA